MDNTSYFHYEALLLIPTVLLYLGVVGVKWKDKLLIDLPFITLLLFTQLLCVVSMSIATNGQEIPDVLWEIQSVITCLVIPFSYAYICRACGTNGWDRITYQTLALLLLVFIPQLDIQTQTGDVVIGSGYSHTINLYQDGELIQTLYITNLIIILQTLMVLSQVPRAVKQAKRYRVSLSKKAQFLCLWWGLSFLYVMAIATIPPSVFQSPVLRWGHIALYAIFSAVFFLLLYKRYDVNAVTIEGKAVNFTERVNDFTDIARRVRVLFEEKEFFLQDVTLDEVASRLSTNRTYLSQVMRSEFDTSFADYVVTLRINRAKKLLLSSNDTLETIAKHSGFNSDASFCRAFKREVGTTPDMWRRETRLRQAEKNDENEQQ